MPSQKEEINHGIYLSESIQNNSYINYNYLNLNLEH